MNDPTYNPDDLGFLISRGLDEDLSAVEQRRLDEAIRASTELGEDARAYAATDQLIRRWALQKAELDWEATAGLTQAQVDGAAKDNGLRKVDALLHRWGTPEANLSNADLVDGVLRRIRLEQGQFRWRRLVFRLGAPLAAAAAVAIVLFGTTWFKPVGGPTIHVVISGTSAMASASGEEPRTVVSFAPGTEAASGGASLPPSIGFLTLGAEPRSGRGEASPL